MISGTPVIINYLGGANLALSVVGGTEAPTFPSNNTAWVNTSVAIGRVYVQWLEPESPTVGDVWIKSGYGVNVYGDPVVLDSHTLTIFENPYIDVTAEAAKQWDGTSWVVCGLSIYKDGEWIVISAGESSYISLAEMTEGDIVMIAEDGVYAPFYVAAHNYESALNGEGRTLLLRQNIHSTGAYGAYGKFYSGEAMDAWFNGDYAALLSDGLKAKIGTTTFYCSLYDTAVGTLSKAIFTPSVTEYSFTHSSAPVEGSALPIAEALQTNTYNDAGEITASWTRTTYSGTNGVAAFTLAGGGSALGIKVYVDRINGYRPCFTLPATEKIVVPNGNDYIINL